MLKSIGQASFSRCAASSSLTASYRTIRHGPPLRQHPSRRAIRPRRRSGSRNLQACQPPCPSTGKNHESGGYTGYVYFPTACTVSLLHATENGASAEIAIVGNEGLVGISLFMVGESTTSQAVVQCAGEGYRLRAKALKKEFAPGGALQQLALRYTQALIAQMAQTAVCNRHHSLDQQLCRRLLLTVDRLPTNELWTTRELIASMLGVRRESVSAAAGNLQAAAHRS